MHSDADLRLVAKAIGFQSKESGLVENEEPFDWFVYPNGRHSNGEPLPDLRNDDAEATKWLLPWLEKQVGSFGTVRTEYHASSGYSATAEHHEAAGESMWSDFKHHAIGYSRAEALFRLCLAIAKEKQP